MRRRNVVQAHTDMNRMIRFCLMVLLGIGALCLIGCSSGTSAIYAGAPDGSVPTSTVMSNGGHVTLFHVTQWDSSMPLDAQQVAGFDLRPGEKVGFEWKNDKSKMYDPDAHVTLQAYAGEHRLDLGRIMSPTDRYYWADAGGWGGYWGAAGERATVKALTLH